MPRAVWSGSISFGLVNIPIKLYPATKERRIQFHRIHEKSGARVQQKLVCPESGCEVQRHEVVKGYQIDTDNYVTFKTEEIEAVAPEKTHIIEIISFVDLASIDPIFFNKTYYVLPSEYATKSYSLLVTALTETQKAAVGRFVMRSREYLTVLRVLNSILCMETMFFADEIVDPVALLPQGKAADPNRKELEIAKKLITLLTTEFRSEDHRDSHRERVSALIQQKIDAEEITPASAPVKAEIQNLIAALEKSIQEAEKNKKKQRRHRGA